MASFQAFLEELFAPIGGVAFRHMFGGVGIYRDCIMFAMVADDVLYMKTDESSALAYAAEGSGPFIYEGRGRTVAMPYWRLPERLYDEPEEFREWALIAFGVAQRAKSAAPARKPRPKQGAAKRRTKA